jgi:signal transduction histidine kinase
MGSMIGGAGRWRVAFVVASVAASSPVLALSAGPPARTAAAVLIVVQAAALWWLADRPWLGTVIVLLVSAGLQLMFPSFGPGIAFVVLCTYAWLRPATETLWVLGFAVFAVCLPAVVHGRWVMAGLWLGAVLLAWSWGALVRARGERRVAERRQAVLEERARIARELHDVLSHTVSVMVVQAAAAGDVFESNPQKAREAMRRTEETGRQALAELRGFMRAVRSDDEMHPVRSGDEERRVRSDDEVHPVRSGDEERRVRSGDEMRAVRSGDGAGDFAPQPTLADVGRLTETMTEAGLPVTLRRDGDGEVPLSVQVGAYRIVQEALTNTLRHARASAAEVLVRVDEAEVRVRIRDDGRGGPPGRGGGHGLIGMRERASLLGGTLTAGPRTDAAGFEVEALLPVRVEP